MGKKSREKKDRKEGLSVKPEKAYYNDTAVPIWVRIIELGTYLILFTPFIVRSNGFFPFVGPKSIYFMALVEIVFFAWLILIINYKEYRPRFNAVFAALALYLAVFAASTFFSIDPSRSFWSKFERMTGLLMQIHLFAFFLAISSTFRKYMDWIRLFYVSVSMGLIMSILSILSNAGVNILGSLSSASRGGVTLGNTSFLATYLLFNVFLALYLFIKSNEGLKIFSGFSFITIAIALVLSTGRAAAISFAGGLFLLFFLWLAFCGKNKWKLLGKIVLIIGVISTLIIGYLALQQDSFVYEKLVKLATKSRYAVGEIAYKSFEERPILGWGPENFELVFSKHYNPSLPLPEYGGEVWFDRAHNIILDTLVTTGILGFLSYLIVFGAAFYVLWKKFLLGRINFWTTGTISVLLIAYFIQNITVFDMISSYMMLFLVLAFVAQLAIPEDIGEYGKEFGRTTKKVLTLTVFLLFIPLFFYFVIGQYNSNIYIIKSMRSTDDIQTRIFWAQKALASSPVGKYQIRNTLASALLHRIERGKVSEGDVKEEFDFLAAELNKTIQASPLDFRTYLTLGQLYNAYSRFDNKKIVLAENILNQALAMSPSNQQVYWALAQTKLLQNNKDEAILLAEKAVEVEPRVARSHLILIQVVQIAGDLKLAKEKAIEAVEMFPELKEKLKYLLD